MTLTDPVIRSACTKYTIDRGLPSAFLYAELLRRALELVCGITLRWTVLRGRSVQIGSNRSGDRGPLFSIGGVRSIVDASGSRGVRWGRPEKMGRLSIVTTAAASVV